MIFVTGMARSGTSLLDKLISTLEGVQLYSQPLPLLFSQVKSNFLKTYSCAGHYPLNDLSFENAIDPERWHDYLLGLEISKSTLSTILASNDQYSGNYAPSGDPSLFLSGYRAGSFSSVVSTYLEQKKGIRDSDFLGLKETWAEEYIPYFLSQGWKTFLIVRDIRDVVSSLHYGAGNDFAGLQRPLLYLVRSWRKSVAFYHQYRYHPNVFVLRYEDVVARPQKVIAEVADFLDRPRPQLDGKQMRIDLRNPDDNLWLANSSFGTFSGISDSRVGMFQQTLSDDECAVIENLCFFEMLSLGYQAPDKVCRFNQWLDDYQSTELVEREELSHYLLDEDRKAEERSYRNALLNSEYRPDYFLFERSFSALIGSANGSYR